VSVERNRVADAMGGAATAAAAVRNLPGVRAAIRFNGGQGARRGASGRAMQAGCAATNIRGARGAQKPSSAAVAPHGK